jgi:hypothetical protein
MLLPDLAREIEEESAIDATSTHVAPGLLGSQLIRFGEERTRLLFGLRNADSVYQELTQSEFLSALEEDLDKPTQNRRRGSHRLSGGPHF